MTIKKLKEWATAVLFVIVFLIVASALDLPY